MAGKFELKSGANDSYRFNLKAGNGEIILTSESYKSKSAAEGGIQSVKNCCSDDARYERKMSKSDQPYFVLASTNGQIVGRSEMYSSASAMENGIASVQKNAPDAEIKDITD